MIATDELRSMAASVGLEVPQAATMMMGAADAIEGLEAENAKLREFAHGLIDGYECGRGELCEGCAWDGMDDPRTFNCKVRVEARKLGVEE